MVDDVAPIEDGGRCLGSQHDECDRRYYEDPARCGT